MTICLFRDEANVPMLKLGVQINVAPWRAEDGEKTRIDVTGPPFGYTTTVSLCLQLASESVEHVFTGDV